MPSQLRYFGVCFCCLKLPLMGNVEQVSMLANILGCGVASLLVKYLGLPLGASYKAKHIWDGAIEKIEY
jgi:hypothetical protein